MKLPLIPLLTAVCVMVPVSSYAKTIKNKDELISALAIAKGGETFTLSPGDYGSISIKDMHFSNPITIKSADSANPARLGQTTITTSSGIAFDSITFTNPLKAGANRWDPTVNINTSSGISFNTVKVHGSKDNNPTNDGYGIVTRSSDKISIQNSAFTELMRAVVIHSSSDISLKNNDVFKVQSEGFNFSGVQNVKITGNRFKDFYPQAGDHPDAIQILTQNSTQQSKNILISNNLIVGDANRQMQGIFVTTQNESPYTYDNIVISNNILTGTMWHGIALQDATNSSVTGNLVYTLDGQKVTAARIQLVNVEGVLSGNMAKAYIIKDGEALKQANNLTSGFEMSEAEKAIAAWVLNNKKPVPGGTGTWDDPLILPEKPDDGFGSGNIDDIAGPGKFEQVVDISPIDEGPDIPGLTDPGHGSQVEQGSVMSAVPEPATWAQLLLGFGLVGWLVRRGRPRSRFAVQ